MELYDILEIKPNASEMEIKKAYLRLVKIYHPDKNKDKDSTLKFQKIQSAYDVLINNELRQEYLKMTPENKINFIDILNNLINENFNIAQLKKYGLNLDKLDFDYIQKNFYDFFNTLNIGELLGLFKGVVPKKDLSNLINCSDSEKELFDESCAEYYYNLPISFQKFNPLDIKLDLAIKLGDVMNKNKRKIKIKRKIYDNFITSNYIFNLNKPYIVYIGGGDSDGKNHGNLIIKLNLPNNLYWNENFILVEQSMNLYEMVYGLDINLELGDNQKIYLTNWVPSRDGFLIDLNNLISNINNLNIAIKLYLSYDDTLEKRELLKSYFC
jgi:hypothetical protein